MQSSTRNSSKFSLPRRASRLSDACAEEQNRNPLLAGYFFADAASAKYLAQFLPCHISLVNQIPTHLLVGPAAPVAHKPEFLYRYDREMFSTPRPQFINKASPVFRRLDDLISNWGGKDGGKGTASELRGLATKPLPPTRQSDNKAIGFFESGLLTGAGIYLAMILPVVGYSTYFLGKKGLAYAAKLRQH